MADETTTDTTANVQTETTQTESSQDERRFSQADVDNIVRERLARAKTSAPPKQEAKPERTEQRNSKAATGAEWTWDHEDALNDLIRREGVDLSPGFKKRMRSDFSVSAPEDLTTWATGWFSDAGLKKATSQSTTNNVNSQQSEATKQVEVKRTGPAVSDKGSATNAARDVESLLMSNPREYTSHDIERIHAKYGFEVGNQKIAEASTRMLSTIKLVPDRRR